MKFAALVAREVLAITAGIFRIRLSRPLYQFRARLVVALSCLTISAFLLPAPAHAKVSDLCSSFAGPLSPQEIASLREDVLDVIPIRDYEVANAVKIRNVVATSNVFAPTAVPDGRGGYEILVPDAFRELQCQLIYIYFAKLTGHFDDSKMKPAAHTCLGLEAGGPVICTYAIPKIVFEAKEEGGESRDADGYAELKKMIGKYTRSAFQSIILHEYAHILRKHLENVRLGVEIEADAFAATFGQFAEDSQSKETLGLLGNFATFAVMRFADGIMPSDILHPPFACRARTLVTVLEEAENATKLIRHWANATPTDFKKELGGYTPVHGLVYPELARDIELARCAKDDIALLKDFIADLRLLRTAVTDLNRQELSAAPPEPLAFVQRLRALRLQSTMGRSLRGKIVSVRLRTVNKAVGKQVSAQLYVRVLRSVLSGPDSGDLSAGDFGRLTALDAFQFVDSEPSDYRAMFQAQITKLTTAIRYNPKFALPYFVLAVAQLNLGRCDAALASLDEMKARTSPNQSEDALQAVRDIRQKIVEGVAAQGCERFAADIRSGAVSLP